MTAPPETPPETTILHASCVAVAGRGILILGPSASGKSALALALLARGAALVADDRVELRRCGGAILGAAPAPLAGLIEARRFGILRVPAAGPVAIRWAVDLAEAPAARLPQWRKIALLGTEVELIPGRGVPNLDNILKVFAQSGGRTV